MAVLKIEIVPGIAIEEEGEVTTDAEGKVSISFTKAYEIKPRFIPVIELPYVTDAVSVQIDSWTLDAEGKYIGVLLYVTDDGGKGEAGALVKWFIIGSD